MFERANKMILDELDIIQIMNTIRKLKAAVSAIIGDDEDIIKKTKYIYFSHSTIYANTQDQTKYRKSNGFSNFMDQNDIEKLRNS